jgi:hypothetical protein
VIVGVVAGQAAVHLVEAQLRQDGDAVEPLLSQRLDIITQRLDLEPRKPIVLRLDLLQADDVGVGLLQPVQQIVDAGAHAVDVPGHDLHGAMVSMATSRHHPKNADLPRHADNGGGRQRFAARRYRHAVFCTAPMLRARRP